MQKKTIVKNFMGVAVVLGCLISIRPAHAFVWPTIEMSAIVSFVNKVTTGINKITNVTAQIENATKTINSVGDQVASAKKYAADLRETMASIVDGVTKITTNVIKITTDIETIFNELEAQEQKNLEQQNENAQNTVDTVNSQVDAGASEEEVQETISAAKDEAEARRQSFNQDLDDVEKTITASIDNGNQAIDMLVDAVNGYEGLDDTERESFKEEAEQIKTKMNGLKDKTSAIIAKAKEDYNAEYSEHVTAAFDAYSKAVSDFYAGKIDRAGLEKAGEEFKATIASMSTVINGEEIDALIKDAQSVAEDIEALKENILNAIGNEKDYPDDEELEENAANFSYPPAKAYAFNFHKENESLLLKGVYSTEDKSFLLSKELQCKNLDISKIEESTEAFRDCVVRAKTESDYFCPENPEECQPFNDALYKKFKKNGVYKHILQDYSMANVVNINKIKQYTATWGDLENEESTISVLIKTLDNVDNTRAGYQLMGQADIERPRLWSELRRIDAIQRAKDIVKKFQQSGTLYIDGRDDEYTAAINENRGEMTIESQKKQIFPNVMLYKCDIKAEDVSVSVEDKHESTKVTEAENKIVDCLFKYAEAAGRGTIDGKVIYELEPDRGKDEWRTKQTKAFNDSAFQTLALSVINNYKSSKDYTTPEDGETNIVSLQNGQKESTTARDDYSAGAQINYYTTQQILSIVDADAQSLQTEILKDLQTFGYNYFDREAGES